MPKGTPGLKTYNTILRLHAEWLWSDQQYAKALECLQQAKQMNQKKYEQMINNQIRITRIKTEMQKNDRATVHI